MAQKIEDFGEKIGGARKDLYAAKQEGGLKEQDIQTMTIITSSYHQRWGQVLYCAVGEQYNQESGYSAEIIGNYCYDVEPSVPMYEMDDRIAAWQLAMILGMPEEEIRRLAENELAFR